MNFFKRMIAALVVFFVVIKVLIFDTYAFAAAPVAAETLIELFGTLLVSAGINTQEEVNDMSWGEVSSGVKDGLQNGSINPADVVVRTTVDGVEKKMNFMDWLADKASETSAVADVVGTVFDVWWDNLTKDDVIPTPVVDTSIDTNLYGYGALMICNFSSTITDVSSSRGREFYYCDYIVLDESTFTMKGLACKRTISEAGRDDTYTVIPQDLTYCLYGHVAEPMSFSSFTFYGDVRYSDGTAYEGEPEETANYVGTTADGEPVTLEQIQSGEIPLDEIIIDYDKIDNTKIIELLRQIIIELEQTPVAEKENDNTVAEDISESTSVTLEAVDIASLQVPTGIATVFPFCLPFDFAYGLQLLASKPVPPKFEIPFEIPAFGLYPGTKDVITLDMAEYSKYFEVGRWVQVIIFAIGLCFISFKVVKGVH